MSPALMVPNQRVLPRGARPGKPFIMTANIGLAPGQQGTLDSGRLRNVYRQPIVVTEIRFTASARQLFGLTNSFADLPKPYNNFGAWVSARIQAAGHSLTDDFTPLWMMGKRYWQAGEYNDSDCYYGRWVFPRPMVLLPNTSLEVDIAVALQASVYANLTNPLTIEVAAAAHTIEGVESADFTTSYFPWVSSFQATQINGVDQTINPELTLNNPFKVPLRLQRIVGRLALAGTLPTHAPPNQTWLGTFQGVGQDATFLADGDTGVLVGGPADGPSGVSVQVVIEDSSGYRMTNRPTPMSFLFYPATEWSFDRDLMPHENLSVLLINNRLAQEAGLTPPPFSTSAMPMFGILGDRIEDLGSAQ